MANEREKRENPCPLAAVDRRLEDAHRLWHEAEQRYFNPEAFRVSIQSCIQTLRTVSFILQKQKDQVPNFEEWYSVWQEKMRQDPLLRWMVDARNRIEKQGDLEARSFVRADILASYLEEGPVIEVPAGLFDAPRKLLRSIPDNALGDHLKSQGYLRIQRRWVENSLPDYELLDAVSIYYGRVSELVDDAHRQVGLEAPTISNEAETGVYDKASMGGRLPCMIGHAANRTTTIAMADGKRVELTEKRVEIKRSHEPRLRKRYGLRASEIMGGDDVKEKFESLFETARVMFLRDKKHVTIAFLFKEGTPAGLIQIDPQTHGEKYLLLRSVAREVTRKGADAVILLGEVWSAPADRSNPYMRAATSKDREEYLCGTLVTRQGEPVQKMAKIVRHFLGRVTLDETATQTGGAHFLFAPIYEAWGREIPREWTEIVRAGGRAPDA